MGIKVIVHIYVAVHSECIRPRYADDGYRFPYIDQTGVSRAGAASIVVSSHHILLQAAI